MNKSVLLKTLAHKHQLIAAYYLTCLNYFTAELEIEQSTTVDLGSLPPDIREPITGSCLKDANVMLAVCVAANGSQYAVDMVVVTGAFSCLPDFSQIVAIAGGMLAVDTSSFKRICTRPALAMFRRCSSAA